MSTVERKVHDTDISLYLAMLGRIARTLLLVSCKNFVCVCVGEDG